MTLDQFVDRLKTIKAFKDKLTQVSTNLTLAFSDDYVYNKIYADGFLYIEDMMVKNLINDIYLDQDNVEFSGETIREIIDYIIYEVDFCTDQRQSVYNAGSPNEFVRDVTIFNAYQEIFDSLEINYDTFSDLKVIL
jgi:hypothetical protein